MTNKMQEQDDEFDVETLEASFAILAPNADRLVARFYEELFDRHPAVQPLFAETDMKFQRLKLLAALQLVIANVRDADALVPALQEMGRRHEGYGAEPGHYVAVASVLISVMAEIAGEKWTGQIQKAWSDALAMIAGIMIGAYSGANVVVEQESISEPPEDIERRSADRPWTAPKALESDTEIAVPALRKTALAISGDHD